jgi:phage gp16-like protein
MPARPANRNADLARIHMLKKDLAIDDDEYRALLQSVCGVKSSADLDFTGRAKFIAHLEMCKPRAHKSFGKLPPRLAKLYSMWQQLHSAGAVNDKKYSALESWAKSQTGVEKLTWLNQAQLSQCIESLKAWLERY